MIDVDYLSHQLRHRFPEGVDRIGGSPIGCTREFVSTTVTMLAEEFKRAGADIHLALERDSTDIDVRGFIILHNNETVTVDMVVSQGLVRLRGHPIYLGHPEGAPNLMLALLAEVEMAIEEGRERA